ncbi:MAG TPA: hypothetical protein VD970_13675 [Acetobacteraceae bacterium]|nr:hypothetical protein [Acetobacteraceae bacterium]
MPADPKDTPKADRNRATRDPAPPDLSPEEDRAAGTIDNPVSPGEVQRGEPGEMASNLGGPVDVFPARGPQRRNRGGSTG